MRFEHKGPALLVLLTLIAVLVLGPRVALRIQHAAQVAKIQAVRAELSQSPFLEQLSATFRGVAETVRPSVVHVGTDRGEASGFWGPRLGAGSGWVYDRDGHIVTNHHVIDGAQQIRVRFADGSSYPARLVNSDPSTDVAVLKVDGQRLHPAQRAPAPVGQGEVVFAFGSPFADFDFSMSQGVVSATARIIPMPLGSGRLQNFIQTDAAINPGNSGGPLTNVYGQVVGMNTAILTSPNQPTREEAGSFLGLGFAVPVDMVSSVVDQIIETGGVQRALLGIHFEPQPMNQTVTKAMNFPGTGGVLVLETPAIDNGQSPAALAGIREGDILTQIDGRPLNNGYELQALIATKRPGTKIRVTAWRDGQPRGETLTFDITLGPMQ